ncbi:MAG: glutathione S-transferase family protein, partial [Candidatus Binataceae bacterium]
MAKARLYQFIGSPFCAKARKLLEYKGIEFETIEVDYLERKELLVASGQLMVPAVTLDGGETVVDSHAIAMRLEELYPEPTILPSGWSGIHLALEHYIDSQLEDALFPVA